MTSSSKIFKFKKTVVIPETIKEVTVYKTTDGREFDSYTEANEHQFSLENTSFDIGDELPLHEMSMTIGMLKNKLSEFRDTDIIETSFEVNNDNLDVDIKTHVKVRRKRI